LWFKVLVAKYRLADGRDKGGEEEDIYVVERFV
jgi:hypothetical protein